MEFIEDLLRSVRSIDLAGESGAEDQIGDGEIVLDTLPQNLQRFFVYVTRVSQRLHDAKEELRTKIDNTTQEQLEENLPYMESVREKIDALEVECRLLSDLFWWEVRTAYPESHNKGLGIRDGFKLVALKEEDEEKCGCLSCRFVRVIDCLSVGYSTVGFITAVSLQ